MFEPWMKTPEKIAVIVVHLLELVLVVSFMALIMWILCLI